MPVQYLNANYESHVIRGSKLKELHVGTLAAHYSHIE